jgi:hypothetical protein
MPGPSAHLASKTDSSSYPMRKRIHFFRMGGARPLQRLAHSIAHVTHRAFIWPVDISFSRTLSLSLLNANPSAWFRGRMRYRTLLAMV